MVYVEEGIHNSMMIDDSVGRKILDTAAAIISREGYENLTIRKVAKESGCSDLSAFRRQKRVVGGDRRLAGKAAARRYG